MASDQRALPFLAGGGEMGRRMRELDWSKTPLGPIEDWPQSLRSAASICIGSRFPIVLYWGPQRVVLYNDTYAEILGAKHPWALGRPCREVWSEIWNVIAPMFDAVTATGEATWSEDQLLVLERTGKPEECYFSFSFSPVRGEDGAVDGIFTAVIETTERKKRTEALAELDRAKTAFFSNVSHEFRTPLTLMLGPLEELAAKLATAPEEQRALLALAQRNGQRLLKLVNTLLDFARIEAGRARVACAPLDIGALTAELASTFRSACERAGLALEVDCPPSSQPAWLDREMWETVVLNLLSNAFKYTFEGRISVRLREEPGAWLVTVADTGTGIPEDALPRIFERFHRVEGARGRSFEGSGIGLALVQELVRLHGGTLTVQSTPGRGSAFTVTIPKGRAHLAPGSATGIEGEKKPSRASAYLDEALSWLPGTPAEPAAAGGTAAAARARHYVLLADDNADLRDYARRLLAEHYEVEAVADGEAALAAACVRRPDIVVSDVMMPKLDGFGLLEAMRGDPALAEVPVLLLSARAGEEARLEGLERGADAYLVKPFGARELLVQVGALLESSVARREATARLLEADRRKDEFLAMLSHELRNPLAPIRNAVLLLKEAGDSETGRKALEILDRQVSHTIRLVDDLLDVARITRGTIDLERRMATLGEVVENAIEISRPHLERAGHRVEVELPGRVELSMDPVRMAQVAANLLNNAAKFTPAGGTISVRAWREGGEALLSVRDTGRGMTRELLENVFDMFGRGGREAQRAGAGLGVGLSLSKKLVELHGGTITAKSDGPGRGSEFTVRLPITVAPGATRAAPASAEAPRRRVLVVDDNVDSAQTLGLILRRMGHEVELAHDGEAALSVAARAKPSVVILDLGLPHLDGYGVASRLRQDAALKNVRLIALSGYGMESDREKTRAVGFHRHLVKPVDLDALRSALDL